MRSLVLLLILLLPGGAVPGQPVPAVEGSAVSPAGGARLRQMEDAIKGGSFVKIGSVVIARGGKTVYEHYFDGDAGTLRDTRSATKSITAILAGIAIDEGKLKGVSTPILSVLPQRPVTNPDPRKAAITVDDLLTMSSALECDDWNDFSRGNEERMYLVEDWTQFALDLPIRGRMKIPGEEPVRYGRRFGFSYCTAGAFLMSPLLQQATGMAADRYAQSRLFDPLEIHDAQWVYSPLGLPQTGGGLRLTSRDLIKIAELYLDGGVYNGRRVVSEAWVTASTTPHAHVPDQVDDYGYFWWIRPFGAEPGRSYPAFYMSGNGGNKVVVFPTLKLSVVITSTNYGAHGMHQQTEKLLTDYILPAFE